MAQYPESVCDSEEHETFPPRFTKTLGKCKVKCVTWAQLMWDVYILGKNGSSFNLSVLSSGFHSLGVLSWQVPVVTKWWVLRWAVHWILGLPQLLGLSPGQLSPACPRQTPDAGWLCPLQMQKQDLSSILCASLHTTYSPAKKILIPVKSSLDIR